MPPNLIDYRQLYFLPLLNHRCVMVDEFGNCIACNKKPVSEKLHNEATKVAESVSREISKPSDFADGLASQIEKEFEE